MLWTGLVIIWQSLSSILMVKLVKQNNILSLKYDFFWKWIWFSYQKVIIAVNFVPPPQVEQEAPGWEPSPCLAIDAYDLVVFDLHGTLVCTHTKFSSWLEKLASRWADLLFRGFLFVIVIR